jgi:DNA-binding GntR family transcriptional regulator
MAELTHNSTTESDALYNKVYTEIRSRICLLDYPPGTLLSENALATENNVSRPWIRGVLQRLEFEKLLARQAAGGVVVTTNDIKTVKEAFFLRLRLYELIADGSPRVRVSQSDLQIFDEIVRDLEKVRISHNLHDYGQLHMTFHALFMKFVQNSFLRDFIDQLYYQTVPVWIRLLPEMSWEDEMETSFIEIDRTFQALKSGNLPAAALARRNCLSLFISRLMDYLGEAMVKAPDSSPGLVVAPPE